MIQLIAFLAIGAVFAVVLFVWVLRTKSSGASQREIAEGSTILELPSPRAQAERIFAAQDWEFICSQTEPEIQRAFLQERTNLALSWLRQTRQQATQLIEFHPRAARQNLEVKPGVEMKLAASYLAFLFLYGILHFLIRLRGPLWARKMADYATEAAEQLWVLCGQLPASSR